MTDSLHDRVVLITGATGSLGSAVTHEFAETEARMALTSRSPEELERLAGEVGLPAARVFTMATDVTQARDVENLVKSIGERFGRIDVLLNTVGTWSGGKTVGESSIESWDRMLAINLRSAFLLSRAVLPTMLKNGWGRIVHTSSKIAIGPRGKQAGYAVAKMGVITLTEVIADEIKGSGVTANVILPSIIDTPATRAARPKADPSRWVPPQRIAATMRFLCTDDAATINGAHIRIFGAV